MKHSLLSKGSNPNLRIQISEKLQLLSAVLVIFLLSSSQSFTQNTITVGTDLADWGDETCLPDSDGFEGTATDSDSDNDLAYFCAASNHVDGTPDTPGDTLFFRFDLDEASYSGQSTADACVHFDTSLTLDGKAEYSFCINFSGNPATAGTPDLQRCTVPALNKCGGNTPSITWTGSCYDVVQSSTFAGGGDDAVIECSLPLTDFVNASGSSVVSSGAIILANVCTHPSGQPGSAAKDCTLPEDGSEFLSINTSTGQNVKTDSTSVEIMMSLGDYLSPEAETSQLADLKEFEK